MKRIVLSPTMHRTRYIIVLDLFLLVLCASGVYRVALKAKFPADITQSGASLTIKDVSTESHANLRIGDTIIGISGLAVYSADEIEFLCNEYPIGDTVLVQFIRSSEKKIVPIPLIKDYSTAKIIVESIAGSIYFLIGIIVILFQKKEKSARIFHHLCVSIAVLILLTSGCYTIMPYGLGYILEIFFQASYTLVPVFFLHFTFVFPHERFSNKRKVLIPAYLVAALLTLWSGASFFYTAYPKVRLINYSSYDASYFSILLFFIILFFAGFINIIYSYRISKEDFERRKLRWIFFGITFGAGAYIFLSLLPIIMIGKQIDEAFTISLSVIAPICFAIAIIKFQVFNIDLLFKRSTVYTFVITLLLGVYILIVWLFTQIVFTFDLPSALPNIIGAIFIALLFEPIRRQVQKYVDKKFFRVSYNFHEAQRSFLEEIKFVSTKISLANLVTERIDSLLSVTKIGFFVIESPSDKLRLLSHHHFDILERRNVQLWKKDLKSGLELPVALDKKIEPGIDFESADENVFNRWGMALVLPMLSSNRDILGFLVLGEKLSGARFSIEDISLLTSVATHAGLGLERLKVEYALMLEQAESERLVELNKMKSYFVSSVSHDLKTPLTSIRLFAELLKEHENLPRPKAMEYFGIIEGEADRLSRLITNVLDFAKIEKGTKEYSLKTVDLNTIIQNLLHSLEYQIRSRGFLIDTEFDDSGFSALGDADAISDAITNLITNAMKYSPSDRKNISIRTSHDDKHVIVKVQDEGYGIARHEINNIFDSFYRINDPLMKSAGGAGLGLSLVKHTMDAHHGKVEVTSEIGNGSIFVLYFPLTPQ